jgi:hypothetical protein
MEKWVLVVDTNCNDPAKEAEFNEWYDTVHLQDVLTIPGVVRASRYENASPAEGQAKFIALYEIETEDVLQVMAGLGEGMARWAEEGHISPLVSILSASFCRQITPPVSRK